MSVLVYTGLKVNDMIGGSPQLGVKTILESSKLCRDSTVKIL